MTRAGSGGPRPAAPLVCFLCAVSASAMDAVPAAAQVADADQRALLAVSVNGVVKPDTLVVLRGEDALVAVSALESAGVRGFDGRREIVDGEAFVSLASLAPRITFRIDEIDLRLVITADADLLGVIVRDLDGGAPADIIYRRAPSAFLNYSATAGSDGAHELFTETGLSAGGALLYTTTTRTARGTVRGLTNVTIDRRSRLQRWIIGDAFATGGPLGGDALLAGITVAREFSLAPYFVRHPTLSVSTPVSTPSVLEVHVNGRLVREEPIQPGRLDVRNLPMATGRNETRLVLRDPFGGTREITSGFYLTNAALARGVHDYQYSLGWRRESFGITSWDYRSPVAIARHRVGLTDAVTAGWRLEGARGVVSTGPSVNLRLPFGELEFAAAASRVSGQWGAAAQAGYMYAGRALSAGAQIAYTGDDYGTITRDRSDVRPRMLVNAFASVPLGGASTVTLQHSEGIGSALAAQARTSVLGSVRLWRWADVVGSVAHIRDLEQPRTEASVGLTIGFGSRSVASASALHADGATRTSVDVQRPLPMGPGLGYQFRADAGERRTLSGVLQYQTNYGRYEVRGDGIGATGRGTVNVSGGLVAIGGGLYPSRPIRDSYALVRVPEVGGVRTFSSNQEVGRTGRGGALLVTDLLPYYGNRLAIADSDVPLDYVVGDVQLTLAPPYRGGAVAVFPVRPVQRIVGRIVLATPAGAQPPAYGTLTIAVSGDPVTSPVGADGAFYFENVPPGRHRASVADGERSCELSIDVPAVEGAVVDLGELRCGVGER